MCSNTQSLFTKSRLGVPRNMVGYLKEKTMGIQYMGVYMGWNEVE